MEQENFVHRKRLLKDYIADPNGDLVDLRTGMVLDRQELEEWLKQFGEVLPERLEPVGEKLPLTPLEVDFEDLENAITALGCKLKIEGIKTFETRLPEIIVGETDLNLKTGQGVEHEIHLARLPTLQTSKENKGIGDLLLSIGRLVRRLGESVLYDDPDPKLISELDDLINFSLDGISWGNGSRVVRNEQLFKNLNEKVEEYSSDILNLIEILVPKEKEIEKLCSTISSLKGQLNKKRQVLKPLMKYLRRGKSWDLIVVAMCLETGLKKSEVKNLLMNLER